MPTRTAKWLVEKYAKTFPIDPIQIAKDRGISVLSKFGVDGGASGCAYIDDIGQKVIEYSMFESAVRQRFTIAHELGHHELGHTQFQKMWRDTPTQFRSDSGPYERDANRFAAELLVPSHMLESLIVRHGHRDIQALAKAFNVSGAVLGYRVKDLGLAE